MASVLMMTPFPVEVDAEPSPPKTVLPEIRTLPSHLAGETVMPGTDWREEAVWMTALSALEANTSIAGTEKSGTGGISPGRYPGTVGTVSVVVGEGVGLDVAALCEAAGSWGLEAAQAPRARVVAAASVITVRVERAVFMPSP